MFLEKEYDHEKNPDKINFINLNFLFNTLKGLIKKYPLLLEKLIKEYQILDLCIKNVINTKGVT